MDSNLEATCREWCKSHYWQLQERRGWRYAFHESVMVRYYEEANLDPSLLEPLVEFLKGDAWHDSFTVHNKPVDMSGWKTRDVWYETRDGDTKEANKLKRTRIYHAVYKESSEGAGDGPYTVENGCMWKVSHVFYWKVAALPSVPQGESGVQWRMQGIARDDETGLWSCVLEKRERVQQDVPEYAAAMTMFEHRTEEQHLGVKQSQVASTGKQASVGGGKMVRRQIRKNEDCTSDVTNDTIEERPVSGAVSETTRLMRGTRTTTVNRNQATKAALGQALSVRNEMTDGGLWNQTITTFARILGWFRRTCRKTIFLHDHAETVVTDQDPGFDHVESAGGGVIQEKTVTRNDEGGFDVETRTREEQNVPGAVVETRKFIDGVQVTTVNRGQAAAASAAGLKIGESVRNEKTDGGLVDQTITQASVESVGRTGEACEQNALQHTHSETQGMGTQAQLAEVEAVAGQTKARRVRMTERGAWEVTDETRTAKPAQAKGSGGAQLRTLSVTSSRNAAAEPNEQPAVNEEIDISVQKNEFGLHDSTVRKVTHRQTSAAASGGTYLTHETREVYDNAEGATADDSPARGTAYENSLIQNEMGSFRKTRTTRTAQPDQQHTAWEDCVEDEKTIRKYNCHVYVYRNQRSVPSAPSGGNVQCSLSINEFGLYDVVYHQRTFVSKEEKESHGAGSGSTGERTRVIERYKEAIVNKDGKPTGAKRTVTATETTYWSTDPMVAIRHFVGSDGGHGFKPRLFSQGGYYMAVCYSGIEADQEWTLGQAFG